MKLVLRIFSGLLIGGLTGEIIAFAICYRGDVIRSLDIFMASMLFVPACALFGAFIGWLFSGASGSKPEISTKS